MKEGASGDREKELTAAADKKGNSGDGEEGKKEGDGTKRARKGGREKREGGMSNDRSTRLK